MNKKNKSAIIIISLSLFVFIAYNVLTVEAAEKEETEKRCNPLSEPDDDFYCKDFDWGPFHPDRQFVDDLCDASEDYAKNPKHCDKAYDLVEKSEKTECKEANGDWKNGKCTFYEDEQDHGTPVIRDDRNTVNEDFDNTINGEPVNQRCCNIDVKEIDEDEAKQIEEDNNNAEATEQEEEEVADNNEEEVNNDEEEEQEDESDDEQEEEESDDGGEEDSSEE